MKSEHRHELQTNELGKFAEKMAVFIDVHGNRLMIGVCVASLALAAFIYLWRTQNNAQAAAWRDFSAAMNSNKAEDLHAVWQDHPGTTPAYWARVHEGERWLEEGVKELFPNIELGTTHLKKARDAFQAIVDTSGKAPLELRDRALLGLGRTLESLSDGSEGDAIKAYEALVKEFPNSIYKKDAEERIDVLSRGSGQEFYAWFAKYPRPKLPVKGPRDKISGELNEKDRETLEKINSAFKESGKEKSDDDESLTLPEETPAKPEASKPANSESKPDADPKPDPVSEPDSKPDNE